MKRLLPVLLPTLLAVAIPARAELVIIVNPANPATRMFPSQAAQTRYSGLTGR